LACPVVGTLASIFSLIGAASSMLGFLSLIGPPANMPVSIMAAGTSKAKFMRMECIVIPLFNRQFYCITEELSLSYIVSVDNVMNDRCKPS
jgi:hypothetical protein